MELIRILHLINSIISGLFGIFGCIYLIFLIIKKTNQEMKQYSRVLLDSTITNLINAILVMITDPVITVFNGNLYILTGGILRETKLSIRYGSLVSWCYSLFVLSNFLSVLFYCRYIVLCKRYSISLYQYIKILLTAIGFPFILIIYFIIFFVPTDDDDSKANAYFSQILNSPSEIEVGFGILISIAENDAKAFVYMILLILMFTINYVIIAILAIKIWHYMKSTANLVSSKTKEIQVQLFKTMFYQAVTPIATIFLPALFVLIPTLLKVDVTLSVIVVTSGLPWVPAINSFMTIWLIKPYRNAILKMFNNKTVTQAINIKTIS